jgi:hypothetical protein
MRLAGTIATTLCLICPALAQGGSGGASGGAVVLPTFEYAVPPATQTLPAKNDAAPAEQKVPTPAPSGCPFRDGKLELIA